MSLTTFSEENFPTVLYKRLLVQLEAIFFCLAIFLLWRRKQHLPCYKVSQLERDEVSLFSLLFSKQTQLPQMLLLRLVIATG